MKTALMDFTITVKQHKKHTTITLKKPTTEINIFPNMAFKTISQDKLGRTYMTLIYKGATTLDNYPRKEK
jgi:hypothetical protein